MDPPLFGDSYKCHNRGTCLSRHYPAQYRATDNYLQKRLNGYLIMSTTFVSLTLEAMKEDLMEHITDENLDMLEEFTEEEIADCVLAIASHLLLPAKVVEHTLTYEDIWNYQIKVNNRLNGFVSVSCEESGTTGVSETLYYPFFKDEEDGYFAGLCSLAGMINEAWYYCNR